LRNHFKEEDEMSEADSKAFPTQARVVIIGGGAVGASSLYHLGKAGWTDCVLLEKNELTAGSTWHAAGNVPTFSASWSIMNMEMCAVADLKSRYPFLETHDLEGGLYDPADGDIDPAQLTQALAKGARDMGQRIIRFCPATGVRRENGEWIVETEQGDIRCEYVVNAAGYYAQRVNEWFRPYAKDGQGRLLPMMTMSHQYLLTDEIPELEKWSAESGAKLPLLRDVDSSYYLRQEKFGLNLGPYENNCKGHWMTPDDPMPDDFSFQLYPCLLYTSDAADQ